MNPIKPKKGFESVLHKKVLDFYHRDDVSTALPGKRGQEIKEDENEFTNTSLSTI